MYRLVRDIDKLRHDVDFTKFQNDTAKCLYDALVGGYSAKNNEVSLVTGLVDSVNGKGYDGVRILANKIHGTRSSVQFQYYGKSVTKEFGDMVIISVVSKGKKRLFQRISIIQNKKSEGSKWSIDEMQLFLLKNFPTFSGKRGLLNNLSDLVFRNESRCLGAYGLFDSPGEMLFISAPLVAALLGGKKSLTKADFTNTAICSEPIGMHAETNYWVPTMLSVNCEESLSCLCFPRAINASEGFLRNTLFCYDLYDFVRAWTQLNLGEITYFGDQILNKKVDDFTNYLIQEAQLNVDFDVPETDLSSSDEGGGDCAVLLLHWSLS